MKIKEGIDGIAAGKSIRYFQVPRLLNLGFHILPSKVTSYIPFLSRLLTDLAKTLVDFWSRMWSKVCQISAKSVYRQTRKGASNAAFEGKIWKPKCQGRGLGKRSTYTIMPLVIHEKFFLYAYLQMNTGDELQPRCCWEFPSAVDAKGVGWKMHALVACQTRRKYRVCL